MKKTLTDGTGIVLMGRVVRMAAVVARTRVGALRLLYQIGNGGSLVAGRQSLYVASLCVAELCIGDLSGIENGAAVQRGDRILQTKGQQRRKRGDLSCAQCGKEPQAHVTAIAKNAGAGVQ